MTKRNLLLVGLFLVFGIVAIAPSAFAQTTWKVPAPTPYGYGRAEGHSEATAGVTIELVTPGLVTVGSKFTITYNANVVPGSLYVTCGVPVGGTGLWSSGCVDVGTPVVSKKTATIAFTGTPTTSFGANDSSYMIVVARVDAASVTTGSVAAAVAAVAAVPGYTMSVTPTTAQTVLTVNPAPALKLGYDPYKDNTVDKGTPAEVLSCIGAKAIVSYDNEFIINVGEVYSYALTTSGFESALDPGTGLNGTVTSDITNGTGIVVTFLNVPTTMGMTAEDLEPCSTLNTADPYYCITGALALTLTSPATVAAPTGGKTTFAYAVSHVDNAFAENVDFTYKFSSQGPLPVGLAPITVNVALAPTSNATLTTPNTNIPYFTGAAEASPPPAVVNFSDCVTNLLFPYVNTFMAGGTAAFANFGTGIDFANTTTDPFAGSTNAGIAAGTATEQSGNCTVYFYPANTAVGVVPFTTAPIPSGGSWAFDVASSVPGFAGNTGYAIAICNFQNAYGFEEIYDNYGIGAPTATLGYTAIVLPDPEFYHRTPAGDALGESAIAPINISRMLQKLIMNAHHSW
jgi:hypothetical protein